MEHDWSEEDELWFGKADLQRWGREELRLWGREELLRYDNTVKLEKEISELQDQQQEIAQTLIEKNQAWEALANPNASMSHSTTQPTADDRRDSGVSMDDLSEPSYMRPTKSTKGKRLSSPLVDIDSSPPASQKRESKFPPRERHTSEFSIMADTKASLLKKLPPHGLPCLGRPSRPLQEDKDALWVTITGPANTDCQTKPPNCADCQAHIAGGEVPCCTECDAEDAAMPALIERSRLFRQDYMSPECEGPIPFHIQQEYKKRSESIAKEAAWLGLRKHHPRFQQEQFPEGPERIRFGSDDLQHDGWGDQNYPNECCEMCGQVRSAVFGAVLGMTSMRNSIAHCNYSTTKQLISLMDDAHRLCITVGNERLAMEICEMIKQVCELSKSSWAEMLRNQEMVAEGKDVKWKVHHQRFFCMWRYNEDKLPEGMAQLARDWNRDHEGVGEDQDFVSRVETVKSWTYWKRTVDGEAIGVSSYADHVGETGDAKTTAPLAEKMDVDDFMTATSIESSET